MKAMFPKKLKAAAAVMMLAMCLGVAGMNVIRQPALAQKKPEKAAEPVKDASKSIKLDGKPAVVVANPHGSIYAALYHETPKKKKDAPDGSGSAAGYRKGSLISSVTLWDAQTGKMKWTTGTNDDAAMLDLAFSPDGKTLAITLAAPLEDGTHKADRLQLWDVAKGELTKTIEFDYGRSSLHLAFSGNGELIALAGGKAGSKTGGGVRLIDTKTGKVAQTLTSDKVLVHSVAFSPDGNRIAGAGGAVDLADQRILLWDRRTGKLVKSLEFPSAVVQSLAFSEDGKTLAAAGIDGRVLLLETETGKSHELSDSNELNHQVVFGPKNAHVGISGSVKKDDKWIGEVRIWDLRTRKLQRTIADAKAIVTFSSDARKVAVLHGDSTIRFWNLELGQ